MKKRDPGIINFIWRILSDIAYTEITTILFGIVYILVLFLPIEFILKMILAIILFIIYLFVLFRKRKIKDDRQ